MIQRVRQLAEELLAELAALPAAERRQLVDAGTERRLLEASEQIGRRANAIADDERAEIAAWLGLNKEEVP